MRDRPGELEAERNVKLEELRVLEAAEKGAGEQTLELDALPILDIDLAAASAQILRALSGSP